jgi:hypothetical protein
MIFKRKHGLYTGIAALALILALTLIACPPEEELVIDSAPFNGKINGADVYTARWDNFNVTKVTGNSYDGNYAFLEDWDDDTYVPLSTYLNASSTVSITSGKLTVDLGTPKTQYLYPFAEWMDDFKKIDSNHTVKVSNTGAGVFQLDIFYTQDGKFCLGYMGKDDDISLWYVDSDVTITGRYTRTYTLSDDDFEGTETVTYALNLKTGWNYVKAAYNDDYDKGIYRTSVKTIQPGSDSMWIVEGLSASSQSFGSFNRISKNVTVPGVVRSSFLKR